MATKRLFIIPFVLLAFAGALWFLAHYNLHLPEYVNQHETYVIGQDRFEPGSQAHLRVVVRDSSSGEPLSEAQVKVKLQPSGGGSPLPLFQGPVSTDGTAEVIFSVPAELQEDGTSPYENASLLVETSSRLGSDQITHPIHIAREYRILLTTDKPIYQPGQTIYVRALALNAYDLSAAASQELNITIADGKGNKVFYRSITTSEYGITSTDFQLANEVNTGHYKISATLGQTSSEKTVNVEYYTLPKFDIELSTERTYYMPGDRVQGALHAAYFFGKPVDGGAVLLEGYTFDVERTDVFNIHGTTDADGYYHFEFDLPDYIAGSDLESGLGTFYLQASVTDRAQHSETSDRSLLISQTPLIIEAMPESGQFRAGVENILYVLTSEPDGTPMKTDLVITFQTQNQSIKTESDDFGLAEVRLTPDSPLQELTIQAKAVNGVSATQTFRFEGDEELAEYVLLRPDRPVYRVGETMHLTLLSSQKGGTVYLDIVRQGQTLSTRSIPMGTNPEQDPRRSEVDVDLSPDLYGTLELRAYKILSSGVITRDTRMVIVDPADDLNLTMTLGQESYHPGDTANLEILVHDQQGLGTQAALGLAVVDESVFAVAEQDPGFAKLYFLLENELRQPRYDLHGFQIGDFITDQPMGDDDSSLNEARENAAQAALADAASTQASFSLQVNSHEVVLQRLSSRQVGFFKQLFGWSLLIPPGLFGISIFIAQREKRLSTSVAVAFASLVVLPFFACPLSMTIGEESMSILWVFLGCIILLLTWIALRQKSWQRLTAVGLTLLYGIVLFALYQAGEQSLFSLEIGGGLLLILALIALYVSVVVQLASANYKSVFSFSSIAIITVLSIFLGGCASAALPFGQEPAPTAAPLTEDVSTDQEQGQAEAPRLRQYFPETLLWLPEAETDSNGILKLDFPLADSITTWRMTALASTRDGRLGNSVGELRVFQDFFIDLDLPQALTVEDEISIPVAVYNYLPQPQRIRLVLGQDDWFELIDQFEKVIDIGANEVGVTYFRIRADKTGTYPLKVTAWGSELSDAIQKSVRVYPNGKSFAFSRSERLPIGTLDLPITFPSEAIPGTQSLIVKIHPGIASQVVEGLESILRMPNGCFEQTSSSTYPNVLVLDYLRSTGLVSPEVEMKAEEYINIGYQRLMTFEVSGGGFSLFGDPPADRMLTAYGLQEFSDMSRVYEIDPAILQRTAEWLFTQQGEDGSWENDQGLVHESTWANLQNDRLPVTAYIVWSLIEAGYFYDARTQAGLDYIREHLSQADDPYVIALVANALVAADLENGQKSSFTEKVLDQLTGLAQYEGNAAYWISQAATFMGSEGQTGSIETTALVTLAFLRADRHPDLAKAGLNTLIQQKDPYGTWYTTQTTILALKVLLESTKFHPEGSNATLSISLDGGQASTLRVTPENFEVMQMVVFDDLSSGEDHSLQIRTSGEGNLMVQVTGNYYLPWEVLSKTETPKESEPVTIDVSYDRAELHMDDLVTAAVTVRMNRQNSRSEWAIIDLGLPPGFSVIRQDLDAIITTSEQRSAGHGLATIERYELTGRQIILYIGNLNYDHPLTFSYRLRAKYPLIAQTPASTVYDYYNPDINAEQAPVQITVVQ